MLSDMIKLGDNSKDQQQGLIKLIVKSFKLLMYVSFNIHHQYLTTFIQIDPSLTFYFPFYQYLTNSPRRT